MTFAEIANVSGKSGLYKVIKGVRTGFILESLDGQNARLITTPNHKVSLLSEVSVFTQTKEGSVPLQQVFGKIHELHGRDPGVNATATDDALRDFMKSILPAHDERRVYASDIRKMIKWYQILVEFAPEVLSAGTKDDKGAGEGSAKKA